MVLNSISRNTQPLHSRNGTVMVYATSFYAVFNWSRCCRCILVEFVGFDWAEDLLRMVFRTLVMAILAQSGVKEIGACRAPRMRALGRALHPLG